MSNKKFISGLAIGILAGSLFSLFVRSDKGKKILEELNDFAGNAIEEIKFGIDNIDITMERIFHNRKNIFSESDPEKDFTDFDEIFS